MTTSDDSPVFDASVWAHAADEEEPVDADVTAILDTLEAVAGKGDATAERVAELEQVVATQLETLQSLVESDKEKRERKPRRYRFEALDAEGKRALWLELADFVDYLNSKVGTSTYSEEQTWRIPDWWWKMPMVVFELTALKAAHDEAFSSSTPNEPTTEMIAWIDRWFWPAMNRMFDDRIGLKLDPSPERNRKFTVEDATNDREELLAFLDGEELDDEAPREPSPPK